MYITSERPDITRNWTFTLFASTGKVKCFSAFSIFPTRLHSLRRCSTREEFLLSKHDTTIFSTWWCRKLLYGYLLLQRSKCHYGSHQHSSYSWNIETYSKNKSKIRLIAPRLINSSAALLPTVSKTDMNSTIWKTSQGTIRGTFLNKKQNILLKSII